MFYHLFLGRKYKDMLNLLALLVLPAIVLFLALTHRRKKLCGEQTSKRGFSPLSLNALFLLLPYLHALGNNQNCGFLRFGHLKIVEILKSIIILMNIISNLHGMGSYSIFHRSCLWCCTVHILFAELTLSLATILFLRSKTLVVEVESNIAC